MNRLFEHLKFGTKMIELQQIAWIIIFATLPLLFQPSIYFTGQEYLFITFGLLIAIASIKLACLLLSRKHLAKKQSIKNQKQLFNHPKSGLTYRSLITLFLYGLLFMFFWIKANLSAQHRLPDKSLLQAKQEFQVTVDDVIFEDADIKRIWVRIDSNLNDGNLNSSNKNDKYRNDILSINQFLDRIFSSVQAQKISISVDELLEKQELETQNVICAGQIWHIEATLRPMHASVNGVGFNQSRWAIYQNKLLYAKVHQARLLDANCDRRQTLIQKIDQTLVSQDIKNRALIHALIFGERRLVATEDRKLFIATGIAHLLAISGLHVAVAGLVFFWLARLLQLSCLIQKKIPFIQHYRIPILISLLGMMVYVWLAGAQPPALRTLIGTSIWFVIRLSGIYLKPWKIFILCIATMFVIDPLLVISDSFWLSCTAVAGIIFWHYLFSNLSFFDSTKLSISKSSATSDFIANQQMLFLNHSLRKIDFKSSRKLISSLSEIMTRSLFYLINRYLFPSIRYLARHIFKIILLQIGLLLLMAPIQITLFSGISLTSLPANLIAVPIITLITVPLLMFGLMSHHFSVLSRLTDTCWRFADDSLTMILKLIAPFQSGWLSAGNCFYYLSIFIILAISVLRLGLLRLFKIPLATCCIVFFLAKKFEPVNNWKLHLLDVGHGLAVLIEKQGKVVLYDTGALRSYSSVAEQVILPFLIQHDLELHEIIISHSHSDHAGGLPFLQQKFPQVPVRASVIDETFLPCKQSESWAWQGLIFNALYPETLKGYADNNASCVVSISDGRNSILLTGDLEKEGELALVKSNRMNLQSDILQVPHHGSKTSSTAPFLRAVMPALAINSVARFNPWSLPSESVVARYNEYGLPLLSTSTGGKISILMTPQGWSVSQMRHRNFSPWFYKPM